MRTLISTSVACLVGLVLFSLVLEMPLFGAANGPTYNEVYDQYTRNGLGDTGATNLVTAIVLDYRGFDTMGETTVLFTAVMAALLTLSSGAKSSSGGH